MDMLRAIGAIGAIGPIGAIGANMQRAVLDFRRSARAWEREHRAHPRPATQRRTHRIHATDAEGRFLRAVGAVPVAEILISPPMVAAARNAAIRAAAELGTAEPDVRWFRTIRGCPPARGWFDGAQAEVVWISASLDVAEVRSVVAHEAQHRADHLAGRAFSEEAARAFAARFAPYSDGRAFGPRPTHFVSPCNMRS